LLFNIRLRCGALFNGSYARAGPHGFADRRMLLHDKSQNDCAIWQELRLGVGRLFWC